MDQRVTLIAPHGMEHIIMGNDERTRYDVRSRVVQAHPAHAAALKMMGFFEPPEEKPVEIVDPKKLSDATKEALAGIAAAKAKALAAEEEALKAAAAEAEAPRAEVKTGPAPINQQRR